MAAVSQPKRKSHSISASPILWGALLTVGFFGLLEGGVLETLLGSDAHQFMMRYAAGHPVGYCEVAMFFVALAALVLKRGQIMGQLGRLRELLLGPIPEQGQTAADCPALLAKLEELPAKQQSDYLVGRLRDGLTHVQQKGNADTLDSELKYLSEQDAERSYSSYALINVIIWAIPILGFLGTVIGITMAIANLDPASLESSLSEVVGALGVAFDTTALALSLSMVLMFGKFAVDKQETRLLELVDARASEELLGRFQDAGTGGDPQAMAVRRMAEAMLQATEQLVERQAKLWEAAMIRAEERWQEVQQAGRQLLEDALGSALTQGLLEHAKQVKESADSLAERNHRHWDQVCQALASAAEDAAAERAIQQQQCQLLQRLIEGLGEMNRLEDALQRNLATVSTSLNLESTMESLAGVIHLLNARISRTLPAHHLNGNDTELGHAA